MSDYELNKWFRIYDRIGNMASRIAATMVSDPDEFAGIPREEVLDRIAIESVALAVKINRLVETEFDKTWE